MLSLNTIHPSKGSQKKKKIIGRGGKRGTYSGRGIKGQKARSGTSGFKRRGLRPLMEQTPKLRGFKSKKPKPAIVNLQDLSRYIAGLSKTNRQEIIKITPQFLKKAGLVNNIKNGIKILGKGEINVKMEIRGCEVSKSAKQKIEKNGGLLKN